MYFLLARKHLLLLLGLAVLSLFILYEGITQFQDINSFLDSITQFQKKELGKESLEIGTLKLRNLPVINGSGNEEQWQTYATVLNLDLQTPRPIRDEILQKGAKNDHPIYGLESHPSFLIKKGDISFWRWQFYLQNIFYSGGWFIITILMIISYALRLRSNFKLFTPSYKNIIMSYALLLLAGSVIKWLLDFRLLNFLNDQFYLGVDNPPISSTMFYAGVGMFFAATILEQAIPLQEEQDLTI